MGVIDCFSSADRQAKTVYVRTQSDVDKYNESSYKPNRLQVVVKQ